MLTSKTPKSGVFSFPYATQFNLDKISYQDKDTPSIGSAGELCQGRRGGQIRHPGRNLQGIGALLDPDAGGHAHYLGFPGGSDLVAVDDDLARREFKNRRHLHKAGLSHFGYPGIDSRWSAEGRLDSSNSSALGSEDFAKNSSLKFLVGR